MKRKPIKYYYKKIDYNTEDLESLTNSQLKKVADYWLRQYLLKTAEIKNGKIFCPLKKKWYLKNKMNASHFIDRSKMCTRYHKNNVWLISEQSNMWDSKEQVEGYKSLHHKEFEEMLIEKIGKENLNNLLELSNNFCIFTKNDYINIIKDFKNVAK